ncbi:alpha amylase, catalytic domain protein, partial [Vibrio parahaemolyticus VPTS-2010_2]
RFIRIF